MASEWYVEDNGRAIGPFSANQLKAQAATNRIKPDTRVRKGRSGKWYPAKNVKGLLVAPVGNDTESSTGPETITSTNRGTFLAPIRNRKRRAIIFGCLVVFILIGQAPIHQQLFFDLTMGLIIGSYPLVEVKNKSIDQTLVIFFFPAHKKVLKLRDFVGVETGMEARIADTVGCFVLIFFWYWFLFRLFDHLMPWLGGNYKLFLRRYDDEKVLIWQGNNTADFEANLELLRDSGLPIS